MGSSPTSRTKVCGHSSAVERLLAKQEVAGSNPVARSIKAARSEPPFNLEVILLILGAVGDALGFPVESGAFDRVDGFVSWNLNGEIVKEGEYSDDTQLTLATARSIWNGRFHPEYFAYVELPLWVYYQRGAGRATKKAAMNLFSMRIQWHGNFYMGYEEAGGSGGVMRIHPIIKSVENDEHMVEDIFKNIMITHGHPTAFAGAYLVAAASKSERDFNSIYERFEKLSEIVVKLLNEPGEISRWLKERKTDFLKNFQEEVEKVKRFFELADEVSDYGEYCDLVGEKDRPGSGRGVSLCAVYLYLKSDPRDAVFKAANENGTDTDTIASIVGNLFGHSEDLEDLASEVQDGEYIRSLERSNGVERSLDRRAVRDWSMEYEKGLREGKTPTSHPIFGDLKLVESRGKRNLFKTEEGQTILL